MKNRHTVIALAALTALAVSCGKSALETAYSKQDSRIESFTKAKLESDSTATASYSHGVVRLTVKQGSGEELGPKGLVKFDYGAYDFTSGQISSSTLCATSSPDLASTSGWAVSDSSVFHPVVIDMASDDILDGLRYGLKGVRPQEECYILFNGKRAYDKRAGTISANAPMAFHIWVLDVEN